MNISDKKILYLNLEKEQFDAVKTGVKKSEIREYNKHWVEKLTYPCGTFKNYELILFQNGYQQNSPNLLIEFKGIEIVKEKKGWFKTAKYFKIELGNII